MTSQTKKNINNGESDIAVSKSARDEMKESYPVFDAVPAHQFIEILIKDFSLFQLHELSESVIASLKAFYARSIMKEEEKKDPASEKIKDWDGKYEQLTLLQQDSSNFSSREKMEELIINFAPLLKKQYD